MPAPTSLLPCSAQADLRSCSLPARCCTDQELVISLNKLNSVTSGDPLLVRLAGIEVPIQRIRRYLTSLTLVGTIFLRSDMASQAQLLQKPLHSLMVQGKIAAVKFCCNTSISIPALVCMVYGRDFRFCCFILIYAGVARLPKLRLASFLGSHSPHADAALLPADLFLLSSAPSLAGLCCHGLGALLREAFRSLC